MASLKKKPEAAPAQRQSWHPNFRNYERLPDTKVVRTAFFINGGAVLVAISLLVYFVLGELQLRSLHNQVAALEQQINRDEPTSNQAIARYRSFKAEEDKVREVDAFLKSRPLISNLLINLGKTRPVNVALDTVDLRENTLTLRATVRGAPDQASGYASSYVDALRKAPEFASVFESVDLTNLSRVASTGRLAIEVVVKLRDPAGKKGKK